jgi:hypothetical protein
VSLVRRRHLAARLPRLPRLGRLARRMVALALVYAVASCARGPLPAAQWVAGVVSVRVAPKARSAPPAAPVDRIEALQLDPTKARAGGASAGVARGAPPATLLAATPLVASAVPVGLLAVPSAAAPGDRSPPAVRRARGPPPAGARRDRLVSRG